MALKREGLIALSPDRALLGYWCPGCARLHVVNIGADMRPAWGWNGDADRPTLTPSIRTFLPACGGEPEQTLCHHFLRDGVIDFLSDSSEHTLRGHHPLQPIPADYGGVEP